MTISRYNRLFFTTAIRMRILHGCIMITVFLAVCVSYSMAGATQSGNDNRFAEPEPSLQAENSTDTALSIGDESSAEQESILPSLTTKLHYVWDFELWSIDNYRITVKKTFNALLIIIFGIIVSKYMIWLLGARFIPRTHLDANAAATLQKALFYFFLVLIFLFALRTLQVPLTAFTFIGGALAIGIGFGAQNILNNFISGFIIMAERPIRVGDMIQVDDKFAMVNDIGARCTRITTADNIQILVPNSSFLEKNIINWTLADKKVRVQLNVGVVYGSPTRRVEALLTQAAVEHPSILQEPVPYVRFNDFGDNALIFTLYFWVRMTTLTERTRISSDLRFRIDELFRPERIIIAFPQRDVHLDTSRPLDVTIVPVPPQKSTT